MSEMFPSPISLDIQDLPAIPTPDRNELAPIDTIVDMDEPLPYKRIVMSHGRIMHIINPYDKIPVRILQFTSASSQLLLIQNKILPLQDIQTISQCESDRNGVICTTYNGTKISLTGITPAQIATLLSGLSQWLQGMHA